MRYRKVTASAGFALLAICGALAFWQFRKPDWPREFDDHIVFPVATASAPGEKQVRRPVVRPKPRGDIVRCPVTKDAWFSNLDDEANGNLGGEERLKLKSYQEFSLVDIDPKPLKGRVIQAATLHLQVISPEILKRVSVGSVAADWVEGSSRRYQPQVGSSSFRWRIGPETPWSFAGSDLSSVVLGNGNTLWWMADATVPDDDGWQRIAVEPAVVAARAAELSHGFVVFDDQGSEWSLNAGKFEKRPPANRFVASRDAGTRSAPWLEVVLGDPDNQPPRICEGFSLDPETSRLPQGEAIIHWETPSDEGPAGTIGFLVDLDGEPLPRYLIPNAGNPGEAVELHCRDGVVASDAVRELRVRGVDAAGNVGPPATFSFQPSIRTPRTLPEVEPEGDAPLGESPRLDGAKISIVDTLDKVHPATGGFIPEQPADYPVRNPLWNAANRTISLHAAQNEIVGFQIVIDGRLEKFAARLDWDLPRLNAEFLRAGLVRSKLGPLPDPLVRLEPEFEIPPDKSQTAESRYTSVWCESVIPHAFPPGAHTGKLVLSGPNSTLELNVNLTVWPFELPDRLSFIPELNCYSLPENAYDYYRLAHRHRTVVNRLPYSQSGKIDKDCAPDVSGGKIDWKKYDSRFGPLLDGSAFDDLPRRGVPLETFYLPIHENWPTPIADHYNGSYWADLAFSTGYREKFRDAVSEFARHVEESGWSRTQFQVYLNNKIKYKKPDWKNGSSPWLLDEPAQFQDFWAVRWFGMAFRDGLSASRLDNPPLVFRVDISRPQWQRDSFNEILDYNVCASGAGREYRRLLLDNQRRFGQQIIDYGTSNPVEASNLQPAGWCLDAWCHGADGVLPWNTIGKPKSWETADQLALLYPAMSQGKGEPAPSLRLKSYLRGQQDVEYLALWATMTGEPRWAVGQQVIAALKLRPEARGTGHVGDEDAGLLAYDSLRPQQLTAFRIAIARQLAERGAEMKSTPRPLVPERKSRRSRGGYVTVGVVPWDSSADAKSQERSAP